MFADLIRASEKHHNSSGRVEGIREKDARVLLTDVRMLSTWMLVVCCERVLASTAFCWIILFRHFAFRFSREQKKFSFRVANFVFASYRIWTGKCLRAEHESG